MSSIHETAYPRFKPDLSQRELEDIYTPTNKERIFSQRNAHTAVARLALMVLLKTVQRLGYFVKLAEVPRPIISHIAKCMGARARTQRGLHTYEQYGSRHRLLELIRTTWISNRPLEKPLALFYLQHYRRQKPSKSWLISLTLPLKG
jgi:hypothetical protein